MTGKLSPRRAHRIHSAHFKNCGAALKESGGRIDMIYRQPCVLIVSWRGQGGKDAPEHLVMGNVMPQLLNTVRIPHRTLTEKTAIEDFRWVAETFMKQQIPVALVITKGVVKGLHP
jgi:sulfopyruvate decarboxylase TPP-binding subunit